jgi:protein-S-isoprenylcysteine O-methyltransferase Ste14
MKWDFWGNWVFRLRGQIPLVFLLIAFVSSYSFNIQLVENENASLLYAIGGIFIVFATIMRAYTVGYAAQHSSGRNRSEQVAEHLNVHGAYSMVQNPLYFANAWMWLASALFSNQWFFIVSVIALIGLLLPVLIRQERVFLRAKFGDEFVRWEKVTPVFLPNPLLFIAPQSTFQWIRLLATEYPTWVSICTGISVVHWFGRYLSEGKYSLSTEQYILFICAITLGLFGRFFKYVVVRKWLNRPI